MERCFLFPALDLLGYESGFALRNPVYGTGVDLEIEIARFRANHEVQKVVLPLAASAASFCSWETEWSQPISMPSQGIVASHGGSLGRLADIISVRILSPGGKPPPTMGEIEGQMLYRHPRGWISSLLTSFVPLRPPGHQFAPIIHTGHYFADRNSAASYTVLANRKIAVPSERNAGTMRISVRDHAGESFGQIEEAVIANSALILPLDVLLSALNREPPRNVNLTFFGGSSQFSIVTVFQDRTCGSIGLEHSLAPFYYIPNLTKPDIRERIYGSVARSA